TVLMVAVLSAPASGARAADDEMPAACIDEDEKADLFATRQQRTSRGQLFQQTNRHELTIQGGYYSSDLFDGTYTVRVGVRYLHEVPLPGTFGFAYAYHMT